MRLTSNIIHNAPNVICRGTDTLTDTPTHIYSRFRDKLSLLRSLVQENGMTDHPGAIVRDAAVRGPDLVVSALHSLTTDLANI